jgi:hypothetical protein
MLTYLGQFPCGEVDAVLLGIGTFSLARSAPLHLLELAPHLLHGLSQLGQLARNGRYVFALRHLHGLYEEGDWFSPVIFADGRQSPARRRTLRLYTARGPGRPCAVRRFGQLRDPIVRATSNAGSLTLPRAFFVPFSVNRQLFA